MEDLLVTAKPAAEDAEAGSFPDFFEMLENAVLEFPSQLARLNAPPVQIVAVDPQDRSTTPPRNCDPTSPSAPETLRGFQIWIKGCYVAQVPDLEMATAIAETLKPLIDAPDFDASNLHPELVEDTARLKINDRVLFQVEPRLADKIGRPAELIVIEWTNNLRTALGESAIALTHAQIRMHDLQEVSGQVEGMASWYGPYFHGRQTATGEIYDQNELTAAHPTLPFDTYLKVTNLLNGKSVVVRVNDRGPYFDNRVLDLSNRAAQVIDSEHRGIVPIRATRMEQPPTRSAAERARRESRISLATPN